MRWKLTKVDSGQPAVPSNNTNNGSTMTMDVKSEPQKSAGSGNGGGGAGVPQHECAGCKKKITDRFMLKALELYWHEDCLKCACCDCRLGEVGSTLFTKANLILCKRDYLRLFGTTGYCSACSKMIPAFEMVMRARGNVYHLECFACQQCNHRFCVGDRFYLCDNKILCEYDYEERMVFANMPYTYNSIAHIKRQTQNLAPAVPPDDVSSGITKDLNDPQQQQQQQPPPQQQQNGVAPSLQGLPAQHPLHQAAQPSPKDRRSAGGREGGAG